MNLPKIVSREEWREARVALLAEEKAHTRARDALSERRRQLPMVLVDKPYEFEGPAGRVGLADLFEGRGQLIVQHLMFAPGWEAPCSGCSYHADNVGQLAHLNARDTTFAAVSRAPLAELEAFRERIGWTFPWYSSFGSDFNYDFHVTLDESVAPIEWNYRSREELVEAGLGFITEMDELNGLSVFLRDGERVYHTYTTYGRGVDTLLNTYNYLDLTPLGRREGWGGTPDLDDKGMDWIRHHDRY